MPLIIEPVKVKTRKNLVSPDALIALLQQTEEQGQVIVHVFCPPQPEEYAIRVWRTTYLVSRTSSHKSRLLHAENISLAPAWTEVKANFPYSFTLIFESLPKDTLLFDLAEIIPQPGGFYYPNLLRNERDVYDIRL
jgi:hypothetical protein